MGEVPPLPRTLVYCPTYQDGNELAIWPETSRAIERLAFDGDLMRIISDDNPYPAGDRWNVLYQYQKARAMALDGLYDALLTVEHDMLPPGDGLQKLWDTGAPVAYGVYLFRSEPGTILNALRYTTGNAPDSSLSSFPDDLAVALLEVVANVSGAGFGFTLIRREVLEAIPFRGADNTPLPDMPFAADCVKAGIRQVAHFGVLCGHIKPDGSILWPEAKKMTNKAKVLILQNFTASDNRVYTPGEEALMDHDLAQEYKRCGFVRLMMPAVKATNHPERTTKAVKGR